jgi:pilus assembly protein Flp/PilA
MVNRESKGDFQRDAKAPNGPATGRIRGDSMPSQIRRSVVKFLRNDDGPTAVEYALAAVLILAVCITVIALMGQDTGKLFSHDADQINARP